MKDIAAFVSAFILPAVQKASFFITPLLGIRMHTLTVPLQVIFLYSIYSTVTFQTSISICFII